MSAFILYVVQRVIFPALFGLCIISRPTILSMPYLVFLVYAPFLPFATKKPVHSRTRNFIKCVIAKSAFIVLLQIGVQLMLYVKDMKSLQSMGLIGNHLQSIGITELYKPDSQSICWSFIMDVFLCVASIIAFVLFKKILAVERSNDIEESVIIDNIFGRSKYLRSNSRDIFQGIAITCVFSTLLLAATLRPSIPSAMYFMAFLLLITFWALNKSMYNSFVVTCRFLCVVLIIHIFAIFIFQTSWFHKHVNQHSTILRLFGLKSLFRLVHNNYIPMIEPAHADVFLNPIALFLCYYASVIFLRDIHKKKDQYDCERNSTAIPLDSIGVEQELPKKSSMTKSFINRVYSFVCRHSNIVSNFMMMLWSIVFRSWLSFVFLLVVIVLWTRSIQRKSVHRYNLLIVLYADFLLILQYICCVIHTADELPFHDKDIFSQFAKIGIVRYEIFPCVPLLFKSICILTFCFTLRQIRSNEKEQKRASTRSTHSFKMNTEKKATIWKLFQFGVNVLTHFWVLIILLTMFIYAICGNEVNLMKLCYMVYVLVFIISYQLSLYVWRHMVLYALWMLVNVTANLNLILVFIYQFEGLDNIWEHYLGIDKHTQTIIGLQRYETIELVIQLLYFTFLVVITAIQLLIFHKKYTKQFMWESTDQRQNTKKNTVEQGTSENSNDKKKSYIEKLIRGVSSFTDTNAIAMGWICRFLELQFFKFVLILGFLMTISEISSFNLLLNILVIFACLFENYSTKLSCGIISMVAGTVIISKMLYQLLKIPESLVDQFCFFDESAKLSLAKMAFCNVNNTAQWVGIHKLNVNKNHIQFLAPYLIFLGAATLFTSVVYYQMRKRYLQNGESKDRTKVLFENISHEDADKSVNLLIKYLFNYGFYKFGIEVTLIMLVILINFRRDLVSIIYIIWLCIIFGVRRKTKHFIWPIFQYFVTFATIAQYVIMLNLPSFLYSDFQREFDSIQRIEAMIVLKNHPKKLLFDFLLLICICRQQNVFRIEEKYGGRRYPGGRNESSVKDISIIMSGQLPIRTHDYLYPTNWIDILKCVVFFSSFWVTLSIVLLTGTNNISAFSMGYLISSFLFCYIGTNFYMKPIGKILQWWNTLIVYNVFVIITKSILNLRFILNGAFESNLMAASVHSFLNEDKQTIQPLDMGYDCLCFAFLIFQLRIFKSFDFCHIINESKATFVCDSRGTKLLADRMYEMHTIQMHREKETLEKIKLKVERIKANQQKFEPNLIPANTHHQAVRYNGKYLYEELVERGEFLPQQNESRVESDESFLLNRRSRLDSTMKASHTIEMSEQSTSNQCEEEYISNANTLPKNYTKSILRDLLISITLYLYKFSRNYRFVHEILTKEKKLLKLKSCGDQEGLAEERIYFFAHQHSVVSEFFQALWFSLIANTDIICYLFIFLNTILSMSILTLPMSLGVCLWAALTIPRPSKRFWLTVIAYTEVLVFVQYFLQIISHFHKIEMAKSNATYNLALLHFVLFHRSVLKHMGTWTYTRKMNKYNVHALNFLNIRWLKSTVRCNSIVQIPADVYTFMFLCDLFNFFVLMFCFSAFSQSPYDAGVHNYLQENQIPFRFLLALLLQFVSLIIDRALYLRRNMKGKIIFYLFSVIAMHLWQFHFMQTCQARELHSATWPPKLFYFIKCVYFLLSAYQIRCSYPKRVSGNFANNGFSLMHWRVFEVYQMIPFLSEARTLLDWLCIKTSLSLYEWFKMEDIYADMFVIKCNRQYEKSVPRARGVVRGSKGDYLRAVTSLMVFFVLIWGPWGVFTFDYTLGKSNLPNEVGVILYAGTTEPIYRMTAQTKDIHQFTERDLEMLRKIYENNTDVQSFIANYEEQDIAAITLDVNSTSLWIVSPSSFLKFKQALNDNETIKFRYSVSISRQTHDEPNVVEISQSFHLDTNNLARQELIRVLDVGGHEQRVHLPGLFPKFLKVMNSKGLQAIPQFLSGNSHQNITLRLNKINGMQWWEFTEDCNGYFYQNILSKLPHAECKEASVLYTFNDKLFPKTLSPFIRNGIIGLYSMYILLTWKFFRQCLASKISDIIQKDLPCVDRILQLCSDIYLVREQCDFKLEEDLYAKLIFLYRSPETMIRWTRLPENESTVDDQADIDESDAEKALRKSLNHRII